MTKRLEPSSYSVANLRVDFRLQRLTCAPDSCVPVLPTLTRRASSLNLDSLIWTVPTPPTGLTGAPPPRSGTINAFDSAANQRQCHLVIGGRDNSGNGLSDVWVRVGKIALPPELS
jgi:hypothetical protein